MCTMNGFKKYRQFVSSQSVGHASEKNRRAHFAAATRTSSRLSSMRFKISGYAARRRSSPKSTPIVARIPSRA